MIKNKLSKVLCSVVMCAVMLANVGLGVQAVMELDPADNIKFSEELTNNKGVIEITRDVANYKLYYQFVETNNDTYSRIAKIKDTLRVIQALRLYELDTNEQNYIRYVALQDQFEAKYGERVTHGTEADVEALLNELNDLLSSTMYNDSAWTQTTSNMFEIDASKFTGNKNFMVWAKLLNSDTGAVVYDADIYQVVGTGSEEERPDENTTTNETTNETTDNTTNETTNNTTSNETANNTVNNNTTNNTTSNETNNTSNNTTNKTSNNESKSSKSSDINTTKDSTTAKKSIPQTGTADIYVVAGIGAIAIAVGAVSFIKYRKMK